jgi:hypothetical protein
MAIGTTLKIAFDGSAVQKGMGRIRSGMTSIANVGKKAALAIAGIAAGITAAAVGFTAAVLKINKVGEAANTSEARLRNVVDQMGLFGDQSAAVSQRLLDLASKQTMLLGIDKKTIQMTQSKLLTFRELAQTSDEAGGAFDRATMAALDLASAGFGTAETNAVQLGRALNDPIRGINALARSGVTFTQQEREKIRVLVESNKMLEAQDVILRAIENQVGNASVATANASDRMAAMASEMRDAFAGGFASIMALTPDMAQDVATQFIEPMRNAGRFAGIALIEGIHGNLDKVAQLGKIIADVLIASIQPMLEQAIPRMLEGFFKVGEKYSVFGYQKTMNRGLSDYFGGMRESIRGRTADIMDQRNIAGQFARILEQGNITEVPNLPGYRFAREGEESNLYAGDKKIVPILEIIARNTAEGATM